MSKNHFILTAVEALPDYCLRLVYADGQILQVDLAGWINTTQALATLKEAALFSQAKVGFGGHGVDWIEDELDLAADNLRNLAIEQAGGIGHERIWNWLHEAGLTLEQAAEALGISRRMLIYYRGGEKPIPRSIWLACLGREAVRPLGRDLPMRIPTAREYAAIKRQRTIVGRLARELDRKASAIGQAVREALDEVLGKAQRIVAQSAQRKALKGQPKLYAWHAPEVDCISKGKARRPYEFGEKVGIARALKGNLIVGARAFHRNPYDGHTLNSQLEQATILMQDCAVAPETVFVDLGYRGVDADNPGGRIVHRGKPKRLSAQEKKQLKRRQAIEPIIGHLKADHRMDRCHLKGEHGDQMHAVLCAAGYNIKWLLRKIAKKGMSFLRRLFLRLKKAVLTTQSRRGLIVKSLENHRDRSWVIRPQWRLAA